MALQKNEDFSGITCNYWKILKLTPDYVEGQTSAILGLYKDADTRNADINNIVKEVKIWADGVQETRADMYPLCKASGVYLEGADDC